MDYFRNVETGEIRQVESHSEEAAKLKAERTSDNAGALTAERTNGVLEARNDGGRFPLWEQTGAHDADPANHASEDEVADRSRWAGPAGLPLSDVTSDGYGQSAKAVEKLDHRGAEDAAATRRGTRSPAAAGQAAKKD